MVIPQAEVDTVFIAPDLFGVRWQEDAIDAGIADGRLPDDTYLRVRAIGVCAVDWADNKTGHAFALADDIAKHIDTPERMRPDSQRLLWGERPDAVIDWEQHANKNAYTAVEPMYYRMANLAWAIGRVRAAAGQSTTDVPSHWYATPEEVELSRCYGWARPIWRTIVQRIHPEWLTNFEAYCPRITYGAWNASHELSDRTMRRYIVDHAVISDTVVYNIHNEAVRTGVKGIGPRGRESLRELLVDEHPELH